MRRHQLEAARDRTRVLDFQVIRFRVAHGHESEVDILVVFELTLTLERHNGNLERLIIFRLDGDHVIELTRLGTLIDTHEFPVETGGNGGLGLIVHTELRSLGLLNLDALGCSRKVSDEDLMFVNLVGLAVGESNLLRSDFEHHLLRSLIVRLSARQFLTASACDLW